MRSIAASALFKNIAGTVPNCEITSVVTDSRQAQAGAAFVCIEGENTDGHLFAQSALQQGAEIVLAQKPIAGISKEKCIVVENTLDALISMAQNYREQFHPVLVGITGSVGKTTTKEFCYAVFSAFGDTIKTQGNQNNEIGMPNTIFRIDDDTQYAVVEMGMQGLGEISKLTKAAKPMGAIITGIGHAHLLQLGSRENILKAKLEICEGMPSGAPLILNADDDYLPSAILPQNVEPTFYGLAATAQVRAENIAQNGLYTEFVINDKINGSLSAKIPALGNHNVLNALAAYTLATRMGLDPTKCAEALFTFKTAGQRQNIVVKNEIAVIEDCYNANPDSMRAALTTLRDYQSMRRVAVLGDMLELGKASREQHEDMGRHAAQCDVNYLITVGEQSRYIHERARGFGVDCVHCGNNEDAIILLRNYCRAGDAVLIKASRGMHFEEIIDGFYKIHGEEC